MSDINDVLLGLGRRTEESELTWDRTTNPDEFVAAVGDFAITIARVATAGLLSSERFLLQIMDDEGTTVESLESVGGPIHVPSERRATDNQSRLLNELFLLARRSALDVPTALAKIMDRLEGS